MKSTDEIRNNIAKNITELRKNSGMKQSEFGELLGYSDKTISKWENGSSEPDIEALAQIAEIYNIKIDDLISSGSVHKYSKEQKKARKHKLRNKIMATLLAVSLIWLVATVAFFYLINTMHINFWQIFVWAVPCSSLLVTLINRNLFKSRLINLMFGSITIWSFLVSIYVTLIANNVWLIFILGIPAQLCFTFFSLMVLNDTKK